MNNENFIKSISFKDEEWRKIIGWEDYLISNYGKVVALPRKLKRGISNIKLLIPTKNVQKYGHTVYYVKLYNGEKEKLFLVHRLVAKSFIPNPYNKLQIDHIDGDTSNNHVSNLKWCTSKENMNNPITKKRMSDMAKLRISQNNILFEKNNMNSKAVLQIKDGVIIKRFPSMSEAQREGFSQSKISECCSYKRKSHKGFQWKFQD